MKPFSQVERFRHLRDVPGSYAGQGGKGVRVKPDESGLEFGDGTGGASDAEVWINYPHRPYPDEGDPTVGLRIGVFADGEHNAFPGLALTRSGDLLAVWRRAADHSVLTGEDRGRIMLSRSPDLGRTWDEPVVAVDDGSGQDARDPALATLTDGRIALAYMTNDGSGSTTRVRFSTDDGQTWDDRITVASRPVSAPMVELGDGTLVQPMYGAGDARVHFSTDGGTTWGGEVIVASSGGNWTEPYVTLLDDGTLLCGLRENDGRDIYTSTSTDGGQTWTTPTFQFSGYGRPALAQFSSGLVALTYRVDDPDRDKQVTEARFSRDSGSSWGDPLLLDPDHYRMAYAQAIEVSGGQVAVIYAYEEPVSNATWADVFFRYLIDGEGITAVGDNTLIEGGEPGPSPEPVAQRMVVLHDFGSGFEPVTDADGRWLYGAFAGPEL